jgi:hypothetical protein
MGWGKAMLGGMGKATLGGMVKAGIRVPGAPVKKPSTATTSATVTGTEGTWRPCVSGHRSHRSRVHSSSGASDWWRGSG